MCVCVCVCARARALAHVNVQATLRHVSDETFGFYHCAKPSSPLNRHTETATHVVTSQLSPARPLMQADGAGRHGSGGFGGGGAGRRDPCHRLNGRVLTTLLMVLTCCLLDECNSNCSSSGPPSMRLCAKFHRVPSSCRALRIPHPSHLRPI